MRRSDVVSKERVLQLLATVRRVNVQAAADAVNDGAAPEKVQPKFELNDAVLAMIEASIDNGTDPEAALLALRHLGLSLTGALLQIAHDAKPVCQSCFQEMVEIVVGELRLACGFDDAAPAAVDAPITVPVSTLRH